MATAMVEGMALLMATKMEIAKMFNQQETPNTNYYPGVGSIQGGPPIAPTTLKDRLLGLRDGLIRCELLSQGISQITEPTPPSPSGVKSVSELSGLLHISIEMSSLVNSLEDTLEGIAKKLGSY